MVVVVIKGHMVVVEMMLTYGGSCDDGDRWDGGG